MAGQRPDRLSSAKLLFLIDSHLIRVTVQLDGGRATDPDDRPLATQAPSAAQTYGWLWFAPGPSYQASAGWDDTEPLHGIFCV